MVDLLVYSKEGGHKIYSENLQVINIPVTDKFLNLTTLNERGYDEAYAEFHNSELFYFLGIYTGKYYLSYLHRWLLWSIAYDNTLTYSA
uniref:Uncharacterized protein n=1 Tax=Meloidogyne enterolobii TaxID=390850 RepID=A0A6V7UD28_MELEN|nr:unnamed protein product [Meloidogyne enterolobii]